MNGGAGRLRRYAGQFKIVHFFWGKNKKKSRALSRTLQCTICIQLHHRFRERREFAIIPEESLSVIDYPPLWTLRGGVGSALLRYKLVSKIFKWELLEKKKIGVTYVTRDLPRDFIFSTCLDFVYTRVRRRIYTHDLNILASSAFEFKFRIENIIIRTSFSTECFPSL